MTAAPLRTQPSPSRTPQADPEPRTADPVPELTLEQAGRLSPRGLLWAALRSRRRDLVAASVLYSTHQLGESLVPVIIGATIARAVNHGSWASIAVWLVVLAGDFCFLSMSYRFGARASMRAKQHCGHVVRMWLTDRVVAPAGGIRNSPGDLLSRASSDATRVGAYAGMIATAIAATVVLVFSTILLLWYSLILGAIILVGTVVLLVVQNRVSGLLRRRSVVEQHEQARATALAEDIIRGLRVLKGIGAERTAAADYRLVSQRAVGAAVHATSASATVSAVGSFFGGIYLTVVAAVGGWLALTGHLGLGELVSALGLAQFVIGPMQVVSGASAAYARALASAGRIHDILTAEAATAEPATTGQSPPRTTVAPPRNPAPGLRFDGVRLAHGTTLLDASVPAGGMTGLVCADPAVATGVPALLAREYDPQWGRILITDRSGREWDTAQLSVEVWRELVLVSPHEAVLLPGSIADNLHALSADEAAVASAARAAFADQVIATVPHGADTVVGDRGETLSGGQRQRVALARVLAADAPVLVLHDPSTAVDAATEDQIADRTAQLRASATTVVLTTSPAWLARCQQVIYLTDQTCIIGTHTDLLERDSGYRDAVAR